MIDKKPKKEKELEFSDLPYELKGLKESIEAIKLDVKIDQKGIFVRWRKMFMKEEQRKRMMM